MTQSYPNTGASTNAVHSFDSEPSLREAFSPRWEKRHRLRLEARQDNPQTSHILDPKVIVKLSSNDGSLPIGLKASLESPNNFINYCDTIALPLTNGQQRDGGSCNPAPIGVIPSIDHIPSVKFQFPTNGAIIRTNEPFVIKLAVNNLATGNSANSQTNYLAAPLQLDANGLIIGRTAVVIEQIDSLNQTSPTNPSTFSLYKGLQTPAENGVQTVNMTGGLTEGFYRISSITTGANDQPIVSPVLQHGAIDDAIYLTVSGVDGQPPNRTSSGSSSTTRSSSVPITTNPSDSTKQSSTTLLDSLISTAFASNGQDGPASGTTVVSLTSTNNFINDCVTVNKSLMNGQQVGTGSCNPIPLGVIPPKSVMPSLKFLSPVHGDVLQSNTPFMIKLNYINLELRMTDPQTRYLSAPQQLSTSSGSIRGYAQVVIEALTSLNQTTPTDPQKVAYAAALVDVDEDTGVLTRTTAKGLPAGFYRMSSNAVTENHLPVVLPSLIRGTVNDAVYFTVGDGGGGSTAANSIPAESFPTSTPSPEPSSTSVGSKGGMNPAVLGGATGGAIGGLIFIGLLVFLLLLRRRRKQRNAFIFDARSLNPADYDYPYSYTSEPIPPPVPEKDNVLAPPTESALSRRLSTVSAAPSYHTVAPSRSG